MDPRLLKTVIDKIIENNESDIKIENKVRSIALTVCLPNENSFDIEVSAYDIRCKFLKVNVAYHYIYFHDKGSVAHNDKYIDTSYISQFKLKYNYDTFSFSNDKCIGFIDEPVEDVIEKHEETEIKVDKKCI